MSDNTGLWGDVTGWFSAPFNAGGSAFSWVLFVGLLIIAAWFWHVILLDITREI